MAAASGAQLLGQAHHGDRPEPGRGCRAVEGGARSAAARSTTRSPRPTACSTSGASHGRRPLRRRRGARRGRRAPTRPGSPKSAPLQRRAEENGTASAGHPAGRRRPPGGDGRQGRVGAGLGRGERAEGRRAHVGRRPLGQRVGALGHDARPGEGAGLVEADHVHPGQALDGRELTDQHPPAGQSDGADGERDAGEQHQPLRDHGPDPGHAAPDGVGQVGVRQSSWLTMRIAAGREQRPLDELQDPVDAVGQLGAGGREPSGLARQTLGERVGARPGSPGSGPSPELTKLPECTSSPADAGDRLGLPGEQRLVELDARRRGPPRRGGPGRPARARSRRPPPARRPAPRPAARPATPAPGAR